MFSCEIKLVHFRVLAACLDCQFICMNEVDGARVWKWLEKSQKVLVAVKSISCECVHMTWIPLQSFSFHSNQIKSNHLSDQTNKCCRIFCSMVSHTSTTWSTILAMLESFSLQFFANFCCSANGSRQQTPMEEAAVPQINPRQPFFSRNPRNYSVELFLFCYRAVKRFSYVAQAILFGGPTICMTAFCLIWCYSLLIGILS